MVNLNALMEKEKMSDEGKRYLFTTIPHPRIGENLRYYYYSDIPKVKLEACQAVDKETTLTGTVKVLNIAYHKNVTIRYTLNNWLTYTDIPASYVPNSDIKGTDYRDGPIDRFKFSISLPKYFGDRSQLEFCIKYNVGGEEFWDNNYGRNYTIYCHHCQFAMSIYRPIKMNGLYYDHPHNTRLMFAPH